jgi:hypothetical protein
MKFTQEQMAQMRKAAQDYAEAQSSDFHEIGEIAEERLCTLAADMALEAAAHAFEQHNRENRQWVSGSLWGNLTTEGCARIRALKERP